MKALIRFHKIWRNYCPNEVAGLELSEPDAKDPKTGQKQELAGDRALRVAAHRLGANEAIKRLSTREMRLHGYTDDEIKAALGKLKPDERAKHESFNAGELERMEAEKAAAAASIRH